MVLAGFDIETFKKNEDTGMIEPVLDASGKSFAVGCVVKEGSKGKSFLKREEMWSYILKAGKAEVKRNKKLILYGHNTKYDFYQIADFKDRNLRILSEDPFIAGYYYEVEKEFLTLKEFNNWKIYAIKNHIRFEITGRIEEIGIVKVKYMREGIKFLDSIAIFGMSLKDLGKLIGYEKMEMPIDMGRKITKERLNELIRYCKNDCEVSIRGIRYMLNKLKEDGIGLRNLCTINQIAISYIINEFRKNKENEHILKKGFDGELTEETHKSKFNEEVHKAYRGGHVRVWKTGFFQGVTNIDFNSLYPYSATQIRFPDLRTERKIERPLERYTMKSILEKIGISKVIVRNKRNKLGLLSIRGDSKRYVFGDDKYAIGTWTHMELAKAIKEGYEIMNIEWSVIWDEGRNPFTELFPRLFKKRKESDNKFLDYFYKMIMNASLGKFAQTKMNQEMLVDSIDKTYEYLEKNYKRIADIEGTTDVVFINRELNKGEVKKYYAPIIPTLVNAMARIIMYEAYKKIPLDDLLYSDTDSIIAIGDHRDKFNLGGNMGEFKVERDRITGEELINSNAIIWGTKAKSVGNNIAVSGVFKSDLNIDMFKNGKVFAKKMMGIKNTRNEDIGKFIVEERDLKKQEIEFWESENAMRNEMLYIDKEENDIKFFVKELKRIEELRVLHDKETLKAVED